MSDLSKLIFVYNANSGKLNAFMDTLHKKISPSTYQCSLCMITYGSFTEMPEWKEFRESFPGEMEFLHIDEFEKIYPAEKTYPVVLSKDKNGKLNQVLSTQQLDAIKELPVLIQYFRDWAKTNS
jgi:hypothetical protein